MQDHPHQQIYDFKLVLFERTIRNHKKEHIRLIVNLIFNYIEMDRRLWTDEEDRFIIKLVHKYGTKKWPTISEKLYSEGQFQRTGKQCRERWYNHLNPEINNQKWTNQDEEALFQAHRKHGNKWKNISKLFIGRTDNAIKNHFYSTIRRSLRRINKLQGQKNSTIKMRSIKPHVLSKILSDNDLTELIFKLGKCKPNKQTKLLFQNSVSPQQYNQMLEKLMAINYQYQERKKSKNCSKQIKENHQNGIENEISSESIEQIKQQPIKKTVRFVKIQNNPKQKIKSKKQIKRKIIRKHKRKSHTSVEQIVQNHDIPQCLSQKRSKTSINYLQLHEGITQSRSSILKQKGFHIYNDETQFSRLSLIKPSTQQQIKEAQVGFQDYNEEFQYEQMSQSYKQNSFNNIKSIFAYENEAINCQIKHPSPAYGKRFLFDDLVVIGHQMKIANENQIDHRKKSEEEYIEQILQINFDPNEALKYGQEQQK